MEKKFGGRGGKPLLKKTGILEFPANWGFCKGGPGWGFVGGKLKRGIIFFFFFFILFLFLGAGGGGGLGKKEKKKKKTPPISFFLGRRGAPGVWGPFWGGGAQGKRAFTEKGNPGGFFLPRFPNRGLKKRAGSPVFVSTKKKKPGFLVFVFFSGAPHFSGGGRLKPTFGGFFGFFTPGRFKSFSPRRAGNIFFGDFLGLAFFWETLFFPPCFFFFFFFFFPFGFKKKKPPQFWGFSGGAPPGGFFFGLFFFFGPLGPPQRGGKNLGGGGGPGVFFPFIFQKTGAGKKIWVRNPKGLAEKGKKQKKN